MCAPLWKNGASAPRKRFEINAGFSPGGLSPIDDGLFSASSLAAEGRHSTPSGELLQLLPSAQ